jgi:hypothetical protein
MYGYNIGDSDKTLSQKWCRENSDRFAAFEILKRYVKHETRIPMSTEDLYDKIGVSKTYIRRVIKSIPEKINEK